MKLVFATNNKHKLDEVRKITSRHPVEIVSLAEINCFDDIPETADTLEGNALQKAQPGVYSARYAGPGHDSEANMKKLLHEMEGKENRKARFRTVIALVWNGKTYTFEGIVNGIITTTKRGENGFGYDPIFIPEGYEQTFAELGNDIKNQISHRAKAVEKLDEFLTQLSDHK